MEVVLLAGGKGSRLQEETINIPKPLVTIGNKPILWHIMKIYEYYGHKDFIVCGGYKFEMIKEYFWDYHKNNSDMQISTMNGKIEYFNTVSEDFKISLIDTGIDTETGGRLLRADKYIEGTEFLMTYSDGLSNIDINKLIEFHRSHGKIATVTAVQKQGKFGAMKLDDSCVTSFTEKPIDDNWINGGFFCFNEEIFSCLIDGDLPITLEHLARAGELMAYKHHGDWECMDTVREREYLDSLWNVNRAFWKVWK